MKERRREIFHPLVAFLDVCNDHLWAKPNPELHLVSQLGDRSPNTWAVFYFILKVISREMDRKWSSQDTI